MGDLEELIQRIPELLKALRQAARRSMGAREAEDMAQEIILSALVRVRSGQFRGDCKLNTWIWGIYKLKRLEAGRKRQRTEPFSAAFDDREVSRASDDSAFEACLGERLALERALRALNPAQLETLLLKAEGHSSESIAKKLRTSPDKIDRHFKRARQIMRNLLRSDSSK